MLRDLSSTKLQKIKAEFQKNQVFYEEMQELDALVQAYGLKSKSLEEENDSEKKESNKVFVALTSNKRFYGTINRDVMERLMSRIDKGSGDSYIVIGQTGRQYLDDTEYADKCTYLDFTGGEPSPEEALSLIKRLSDYEQVFVFYPTFINSFRQEVALIDITHKPKPKEVEEIEVDYIFEPDIMELLRFFETQVRLILFNRVLLETKLAQTGARLTKMQRARERAGELVKEEEQTINKELNSLQNMRLLETFAGFQKKERT